MIPLLVRRRDSWSGIVRPSRPIRILVDPASIDRTEELEFLLSYMGHEHVEVLSTEPNATFRVTLEIIDPASALYGYRAVTRTGAARGQIRGAAAAATDSCRLASLRLGQEPELRGSLLWAAAATSIGADALVSGMPVRDLRAAGVRSAQLQSIVSVSEALALVGLASRVNHEVVPVPIGSGEFVLPRGNLYWDGVRLLLPASRAWHGEPIESGDWSTAGGSQATLIRMAHALRARDYCHAEWQLAARPDTDEGIYHLDMLLVSLMGAMDAAARVTSKRLGYVGDDRDVGWQRGPWRKWLEGTAPALAGLVAEGGRGGQLMSILASFRNLVHSEALNACVRQTPELEVHGLFLPDSLEEQLLRHFEALGGAADWGVHPGPTKNDRSWFSVPVFVEAMTSRTFELLNGLMEGLVLAVSPGVRGRPIGAAGSIRAPEIERRELWLLGLPRTDAARRIPS